MCFLDFLWPLSIVYFQRVDPALPTENMSIARRRTAVILSAWEYAQQMREIIQHVKNRPQWWTRTPSMEAVRLQGV